MRYDYLRSMTIPFYVSILYFLFPVELSALQSVKWLIFDHMVGTQLVLVQNVNFSTK